MILKNEISLYAITDDYLTPDESVVAQVKESLEAGVDILQYRNKIKSDEEVKDICIELQKLCTEYNVPLKIFDAKGFVFFTNYNADTEEEDNWLISRLAP